ncbi:MAG: 5-formyltetrahydrofolate cyclo-ligase [Acholeplasmatales bacterium]|nr:5-formyltetrahydrofolate cyclo-ligase [Acholeplasmatales bacterium]
MAENKKAFRALCLNNRNLNNKDLISFNVIKEIVDKKIIDNYSNIGIYYPIGNEIDIMDIVSKYPDKNFYLPVTKDVIYFVKYQNGDKLIDGKFHTKEPIGKMVKRDDIDCFLIPCVGISKDLKRIGYGKGYYDRYLDNYFGLKIGICYKNCTNLDINLDDYDLKLDYVITGE